MTVIKKKISDKFDLIVLGGGPAGYTAAVKASEEGLRTAVIEEKELGGVCLNWGCIPLKSLLRSAEVMETVTKAGEFGIKISGKSFDWGAVIKRSRETVDNLSKGLSLKVKNSGAVVIEGRGKLLGKGEVEINGDKKTVISGKTIIIATGSKFANLPGITLDGSRIITAKEALGIEEFPKSIAIIGSGAMGIEFASIFRSFGAEVALFEKFDRILPTADVDISERLKALLKKRGIKIVTSAMISRAEADGSLCTVEYNSGQFFHCEKVLVATGVTGNIDYLGLENTGISGNWGFIMVDGNFMTTAENIYAIGDCIGPPLLAHSAFLQAKLVIDHITGNEINPPALSQYPLCLHSLPNVASAGLTETAAREAGFDTGVGKSLFHINGMAQVYGDKDGFAKIVFDRSNGKILGAHIIGHGAEDIIQELVLAMKAGLTVEQVYATIHPHPTLSEIIREAAADALRKKT